MSPIAIASLTFICTFGCALVATVIRSALPPTHLSRESQDVVRVVIGLVVVMTALLLGFVTATARIRFDEQNTAIRNAAANVLTLDRHLARYGPETQPTRDLMLKFMTFRLNAIWGPEGTGRSGLETTGIPPIEELENQILGLSPGNDTQRWLKTEALKLSQEVVKARWRALESGGSSVPVPFLVAVIFWLTLSFTSFGLYAPRNGTVVTVLAFAAVALSAAVFLILEMDGPYDGVIKVSSGPFEYAIANLNQ